MNRRLVLLISGLGVASAIAGYCITRVYSPVMAVGLGDELATTNPPITDFQKLPEGWPRNEDDRVLAVKSRISGNCRNQMESIIAASDDGRFSTWEAWSLPYQPMSVGDICRQVLCENYDWVGIRYKVRSVGNKGLSGTDFFQAHRKIELQKWWRENRMKSDDEIRVDIKKWHIERERAFGYGSKSEEQEDIAKIERNFQRRVENAKKKTTN